MGDEIYHDCASPNPSFPPKPNFAEEDNYLTKSALSLIFFVAAFYLFFNKDLAYILMVVAVLLIHEAGHFVAMKYFNYKEVKMFFIPLLGALVTGQKNEISQKQRAIILIAGPFPGIILGLISYFAGLKYRDHNFVALGNIFVTINIFNLLPLKPLDGGNLLETLFFTNREIVQKVFLVCSSLIIATIALFLESYILLIVPFFLLMQLFSQSKVKKIKASLASENIDFNKPYEEISDREYWLIRDQIIMNIGLFKKNPVKKYVVSKQEKQIISQIKSLSEIRQIPDLSRLGKVIFVAAWLTFFIGPLIGLAIIFKTMPQVSKQETQELDETAMFIDSLNLASQDTFKR